MSEKKIKGHVVKHQIMQLLSDGEFHSGEMLGAQLGISRAAISKHVKGIQEWGVDVYRVQGKGYQLTDPIDLLDLNIINQASIGEVELFPVIDSTNQYLLDNVQRLNNGAVCIAEYQANGRGRRGRQWISPYGANLYFSMYWKLESGVAAAMGLSLAIGVAIVDALESLGAKDLKLKWPNDLYYQDKKLAGILVEMSGQTGGVAHLVIGMGLNINMNRESSVIDQPWSNLSHVFDGNMPSRNNVVIALIAGWVKVLEQYELQGMTSFVKRWNELDNFKDKPIKLLIGNKEVFGIGKGITEQGAVKIETINGIETYIGGEISLRKVE
ncbi:Biotin--protein ligase / Biotin operon repressor [Vibrio casei]|uniref:bifunctional biotin--[acetyl-CoA-carboxylase] ligase/biotin operon repressor BirA n=1 Tax=Vibrio sp. TaxID=678 RepID=UPI00097EB894|nr:MULTISPECIES: bifunctional biotin--[acetyl-CoA-carboxylase] ligase/biotin operon repressor BirA [Vibrio]SJN38470.1 Biotin--protein ligase / Biotin operon repressor [Vibrio casei]